MTPKSKSPLKNRPLRNPGQSLDDRIQRLIDGYVSTYVLMPAVLVLLALYEWYGWYFNTPRSPILLTLVATIAVAISAPILLRKRKEIRNYRLGRDGERAVGQYLEDLRSRGAKVYHDIPGENFNIDHVLITNTGVYLIETKTYSKPAKGEAVVVFDGESLLINRRLRTTEPIVQAKAGSKWLSELLEQSTGKRFAVRPVVTFPGWFVEPTAEARNSDVWVLNPKALPSFVENSRAQLGTDDQKLAAFHLSRYIRTQTTE